jgi:hypothetical protein
MKRPEERRLPPLNIAGIMKNIEVNIIPTLIGGQDPEEAGDQN